MSEKREVETVEEQRDLNEKLGECLVSTGTAGLRLLEEQQDFRARVAALLRQIEYDDGDKCGKVADAPCPVCRHTRISRGHDEDCALAAMLRECEG